MNIHAGKSAKIAKKYSEKEARKIVPSLTRDYITTTCVSTHRCDVFGSGYETVLKSGTFDFVLFLCSVFSHQGHTRAYVPTTCICRVICVGGGDGEGCELATRHGDML